MRVIEQHDPEYPADYRKASRIELELYLLHDGDADALALRIAAELVLMLDARGDVEVTGWSSGAKAHALTLPDDD